MNGILTGETHAVRLSTSWSAERTLSLSGSAVPSAGRKQIDNIRVRHAPLPVSFVAAIRPVCLLSVSMLSKPWVGDLNPSGRPRKFKGLGFLPRLFLLFIGALAEKEGEIRGKHGKADSQNP